ncbi:MAG: LytTR family DNA-binding domain-containing protein [Saccharofermentans sp.]|nr:LytTR family DNA-binding domain-containing protein [Saccharofermentans sp.]
MRIAVVDDEPVFRKQITQQISMLYGKENVSCYQYSDGSEVIRSFESGFGLDCVFLDIEMQNLDGMECARQIRTYSRDIPIVFITSHTEMAIEGYEVQAFRFLGKPVDDDKLLITLRDLEQKLKADEKIVLIKDGEELVYNINDLIYEEASNNCVRFVFTKDTIELRMKLTEAMAMADKVSSDFFKCHRSYYINLSHVKKMSQTDVFMDNSDILPIARSCRESARSALLEFVRRRGR